VALEREVGRIDLEQEAAVDDRPVLRAQRGRHGAHVLVHGRVVAVLHRRGDDAR
jgi:hypothetical protein